MMVYRWSRLPIQQMTAIETLEARMTRYLTGFVDRKITAYNTAATHVDRWNGSNAQNKQTLMSRLG
jgi:hypothetical protein